MTKSSQGSGSRGLSRVLQCFFCCRWTDPGVPAPGSKWLPHPPRDSGVCEPDTNHQWHPQYPGGPAVLPDLIPTTTLTQQCAGTWVPTLLPLPGSASATPFLDPPPPAAQRTHNRITGPAPLATEQREGVLWGGMKEAEGPSGCNSPTPGPSPFVSNQGVGTHVTRAQLCLALNKRFCYGLALPCLFLQGVPAQSRAAVLTHFSDTQAHTHL